MYLRGERLGDGQIALSPVNPNQRIVRITEWAQKIVVQEIRRSICVDCRLIDAGCGGAGRIESDGRVRERYGKPIVTHLECKIPESVVLYTGFDIEPAPRKEKGTQKS